MRWNPCARCRNLNLRCRSFLTWCRMWMSVSGSSLSPKTVPMAVFSTTRKTFPVKDAGRSSKWKNSWPLRKSCPLPLTISSIALRPSFPRRPVLRSSSLMSAGSSSITLLSATSCANTSRICVRKIRPSSLQRRTLPMWWLTKVPSSVRFLKTVLPVSICRTRMRPML